MCLSRFALMPCHTMPRQAPGVVLPSMSAVSLLRERGPALPLNPPLSQKNPSIAQCVQTADVLCPNQDNPLDTLIRVGMTRAPGSTVILQTALLCFLNLSRCLTFCTFISFFSPSASPVPCHPWPPPVATLPVAVQAIPNWATQGKGKARKEKSRALKENTPDRCCDPVGYQVGTPGPVNQVVL